MLRHLLRLALPTAVLAGCWAETTHSVQLPPTWAGRRLSAASGPRHVTVVLGSADGITRADVGVARFCHAIDRIERRAFKETDKYPTLAGYVGPGMLILLGGVVAVSPGTEQNAGPAVVLVVSGLALYVLVAARSGGERTPLPTHHLERSSGVVQCELTPAANVEVDIRGRDGSLSGRTDRNGVALMTGELGALGRGVAVFVDGLPVTLVTRRDSNREPALTPPAPMPTTAPPTGVLPDP